MTTLGRDSSSQACVIDAHTSFGEAGLDLGNYLLESRRELDAITALASRGEAIDRNSHDWMLDQVDFIVETIGDEGLELGDEMRSNLLQLLLAIANLNEQIRHQASLSLGL